MSAIVPETSAPSRLFLLFLILTSVASAGNGGDVLVVRSDPDRLVLKIVPQIDTIRLSSGELLPSISSARGVDPDAFGAPLRMRIRVPIALPARDGNLLQVESVEYASPVPGPIAPVPRLYTERDGGVSADYRADPAAYAVSIPDAPVAELRYEGIARDLHVGAITVDPYRFDRATNTIRFLKSVVVSVRYASAGRLDGSVRTFARASLLNASVAGGWAVSVSRSEPALARRSTLSAARAWMRVDVTEEGLYELREEDFRKGGIDPATLDPNRIAIYGGDGGDLPEEIPMATKNVMHRIPAHVETEGGRVTRVLFYGVGPLRWKYSGSGELPGHTVSPYVSANSYIVAIDGDPSLEFPRQGPVGVPTVYPKSGYGRYVYDEELYNAIGVKNGGAGSGRTWLGPQLLVGDGRSSDSRTFTATLPGLDRSVPLVYRVRYAHHARIDGGVGAFRFQEGSTLLGEGTIANIPTRKEYDDIMMRVAAQTFTVDGAAIGSGTESRFGMTYRNSGNGTAFLDYYEIHYTRDLIASDDEISFEAPVGTGIASYSVTGFTRDDLIGFDVTDPANPVELSGSAGAGRFLFSDALAPIRHDTRRYLITSVGQGQRVAAVAPADYAGLREQRLDADLVIITHADLREAAEEYAAYRSGQGGFHTTVVTTDEIYTEFSHGNLDPTAIRDFLANAVASWNRRPEYVILIGDASFDYRGISSRQPEFVPTYETEDGDSYNRVYSSAFDDYFAMVVGNDALVDLIISRIPAESPEQVRGVLEKVRRYENEPHFGRWRQTVVLVGDDHQDYSEDFQSQSEDLWRNYIPNWIEPKKIYLGMYPTLFNGVRSKPKAAQDLLAAVNRGAVITNWIGHGNPSVWAHEGVLSKDSFIPKLTNDTALTLVIAATCNFGHFDDPTTPSGGEEFLLHPGSGAVAVFSTTRGSFIDDNHDLLRRYFNAQFQRDPATHRFLDLGHAVLAAKINQGVASSGDLKYILFGDPTVHLNLPRDSVEIVSIDSTPIADSVATVAALSFVTVDGLIRDDVGAVRKDFNGSAIITLYDADKPVIIQEPGFPADQVTMYGGLLYNGRVPVVDGRFSAGFYIPKDIAFDSATGRLHVYAYNDREDAAGETGHVRMLGTDTATVADSTGPDITIFLDDRTFRSGDVVTATPKLMVDLRDGSGINASGAGLGHHIEAWIDASPNSIDLTDTYQGSPEDVRLGSVERELLDLKPGEHTARVRAWDIFNNPAEAFVEFKVVGEGENEPLTVTEVATFPNPMGRRTDFLFRHNQTTPLNVRIDIFTIAGRRVQRLERSAVSDRFVRLGWDGTDSDGDPISNGVYYYRLHVEVADGGEGSFETIGKLAVAR